MAGRRPTPVQLKLIRGNPGKRRIGGVFEPPRPPEPPKPPPFLAGYALEEWRRVVPSLMIFGLLHDVDVMVLGAYCLAYQHWREAEELLQGLADGDLKGRGLLVRGSKGQAKANPLLQIARESAADMVRYASEFGFGPAARSRIAAGVSFVRPESKFAGLIGGLDNDRPI
jgi:P27 family predicted phage terminase small subunit